MGAPRLREQFSHSPDRYGAPRTQGVEFESEIARYHDLNYAQNGPEALALFLGLPVDEVFPITYDVRPYAKGDAAALSGQVGKEPRERLSEAELIAMAIP